MNTAATDTGTPEFWNKSQLLDRGWTDAGITRFLGEPDQLARNRRRRTGPKIRNYRITRVLAAEETDAWRRWRAESEKRRAGARERADRSRRQTLAVAERALDGLVLADEVTGLAYDELKARASENFLRIEARREERSGGRYRAEKITSRRTPAFFHRIIVNWLRHDGTRYDANLDEYFNMVGVDIAKDMIRERAYALIAAEYPDLGPECDRQLRQRRRTAERRTGKDVSVRPG